MKKILLACFIMLDVAMMGAVGMVLYAHLTHQPLPFGIKGGGPTAPTPLVEPPIASAAPAAPMAPTTSTSTTSSSGTATSLITPNPVATANMTGLRHIGFNYRNSHAHKVDIKADFTQWKSEPMTNKNGVWSYLATLPPGEYEYCYIVDDNKGIRDPTNKRVKQIGTTYVSAVVVSALPNKPK